MIAADLLDLPRLELYVEEEFGDPCALLQQKGVPERIHEVRGEPASWPSFDAVVCTAEDLQRLGRSVRANFAFVLAEDHQLLLANASKLMEAVLTGFDFGKLRFSVKLYPDTVFYERTYLNFPVFLSSQVQTVIDIGAGVGLGSVCFRGFCPEAAIHCFEVDPLALHLLQQNALCIQWGWRGRIAAELVGSGRRILKRSGEWSSRSLSGKPGQLSRSWVWSSSMCSGWLQVERRWRC
ncbi:hypothetical protein ACVWWC_000620 [Thermostichus sp. MS-CIW-32]